MKKRMTNLKNNKKKGFTLIELVVVIAIMAILALIMVPNLTAYINKAEVSKIQANLKNVHTAAEIVEQAEPESVTDADKTAYLAKVKEYSNVDVATDGYTIVATDDDLIKVSITVGEVTHSFDGTEYLPKAAASGDEG